MQFILPALIFITVFLGIMVIYALLTEQRTRILSRMADMDRLAREQKSGEDADVREKDANWDKLLNKRLLDKTDRWLDRYYSGVGKKLEKAHLLYRPQEFLSLCAITAAFMGILTFLVLSLRSTGLNSLVIILLALLAGLVGFYAPNIYLSIIESRTKGRLNSQLGDLLMLLANYLRAGHSVGKAFDLASREVPDPLAGELKKFVKDVNVGNSLIGALTELEQRTGDEDLGLIITAIMIQHQVGGNLSEVLDSIHHTIRERVKLKGEVVALTAEGRISAWVLGLLPIAMLLFMSVGNPGFINVMFSEPLGIAMLVGAAVMEVIGVVIINKMVQIEI